MWFKKEQKRVCGGNCYGGNKGVLPERGKGPAPIPKSESKTFGEELHEIATPIHEENERKNKEEKEKLRKEREANHNRAAKVVFDIMKDTFVRRANNGRFYYVILDEDIKNMLKDKGVDGLDTGDLVKELSKIGKTMGIKVDLETHRTRIKDEDEVMRTEYHTWVTFKW